MAGSGEPENESPSLRDIPVVIIGGPTCSGKSSLAIDLAGRFNAEIISADSRQVYRQLKIGTDRLDEAEWHGVQHHLTGMIDLGTRFTVFDFVRHALDIIADIHARKKRVIVCGGTGLYLRALTDGIYELPDEDLKYRNELLDLTAKYGAEHLYQMLQEADPEAAADLHPHNLVRVIRALEIYHTTGMRRRELAMLPTTRNERIRWLYLLLMPDRRQLYNCIEVRVDRMIENGLVSETERLLNSPFRKPLEECKVVGYSEAVRYIKGHCTWSEMVQLIKQNTRRYAKRQYTWFRAIKEARFIENFGNQATETCIKYMKPFL